MILAFGIKTQENSEFKISMIYTVNLRSLYAHENLSQENNQTVATVKPRITVSIALDCMMPDYQHANAGSLIILFSEL